MQNRHLPDSLERGNHAGYTLPVHPGTMVGSVHPCTHPVHHPGYTIPPPALVPDTRHAGPVTG